MCLEWRVWSAFCRHRHAIFSPVFICLTPSLSHFFTLSHFPSGFHTSFVAVREPSQLRFSSQFQEKLLSWHLKLICKLGLDQFRAVGALLWHWHWPPIMLSCRLQSGSIKPKPNALFLSCHISANSVVSVSLKQWLLLCILHRKVYRSEQVYCIYCHVLSLIHWWLKSSSEMGDTAWYHNMKSPFSHFSF